MDKYTLAVISLLENHQAVYNVDFKPQPPCNLTDIVAWQSRSSPQKLPLDIEAFFYVSNGFDLKWNGMLRGVSFPVGNLHINSIREMVSVPFDHWPEDDLNDTLVVGNGRKKTSNKQKKDGAAKMAPSVFTAKAAFDLDSTCTCGRVCLLYVDGDDAPSVWLQDLACSWSFIASSFSEYFRLMLTHQGVPNWQAAFTPMGLDSDAREWLRFLTPGPLPIDGTPKRGAKASRRLKTTVAVGPAALNRPISARGARSVNITALGPAENLEEVVSQQNSGSSVNSRPSSAPKNALIW
eukprot:CAMPEP_0196586754 /NCGR_PEP_ID=MMETSP1081-20130531/55428_1 /TAXON_ID=36882 /ORGANISM="Pyramimonas amylifera, Strain CCMP720" /LENGTH=293 /DNA_ID=CAMNT_0041908733 /DNA_START=140 /DNA_END=1018 /DNA_ORIENTATION=-